MLNPYEQAYPGYLFPLEAALQGNGRPNSVEALLESFFPKPDKKDPSWRFLTKLVERRLAEGYDYVNARASLALLLQRTLNPLPVRFRALSCALREKRPGHREITLTCAVNGAEVRGQRRIRGDHLKSLNFLLGKALRKEYGNLFHFRLAERSLGCRQNGGPPNYQVLLSFTDKNSRAVWNTVGVAHTALGASLNALTDAYELRLDPRFRGRHPALTHPRAFGNNRKLTELHE
jgi:hypothetical protein